MWRSAAVPAAAPHSSSSQSGHRGAPASSSHHAGTSSQPSPVSADWDEMARGRLLRRRMEATLHSTERPLSLLIITLSLYASSGHAQTDSPPHPSRPYDVLLKQNLVLLGSIFSVLLIAMVLLAVCVYKPIRRR
ncbi:uncharacterized protein C12orf76 homolog [Pseudophryne corroboree]|uniref:uncharacterized protein C12orf76 homolog n=1 Tax=Pseudophryne corroboree TaxID=495146 RepID=UPI003081EBEC